MRVIKRTGSACETYCHACKQLRLWLRPELPQACGNCGSHDIMVDDVGSKELSKLRGLTDVKGAK